jgi:hypothetical protein
MLSADNLTTSCAVLKSGTLNLLEPSGPVQGLLAVYPRKICATPRDVTKKR